LATKTWEAVAPMGLERENMSLTVLDGKLYAVGGEFDLVSVSSVERYDPIKNAWETVAPMVEARSGHETTVLGGKLYVFGGLTGNYEGPISSVERYDPTSDAWENDADGTVRIRCVCP